MSHDYQPSWDYQEVPLGELKEIATTIRKELLTKSQAAGLDFEDITIHGVKNTGFLGLYVNGTQSAPVLLLDVVALAKHTDGFHHLTQQTELTILHEFAHGIQEAHDLPFDEDQAEGFAAHYLKTREFKPFWNNLRTVSVSTAYSAIILDDQSRNSLLSTYKDIIPEGWEVSAHHCTINPFGITNDVGHQVKLKVTAIGHDDKAIAVKVAGYDKPTKNNFPHITLAVNRVNGGRQRDSNNITTWTNVADGISVAGTICTCLK